jgi:alpha-D-ribose 1-methylphosphonate 5-triphosphate synthase subunit PhnL
MKTFSDSQKAIHRRKKIGFIFQSFGLLPLLSAQENVELSLRINGVGARERSRRASECLDMVGLGQRRKHRPYELSGGEQQRVAIDRYLATDPSPEGRLPEWVSGDAHDSDEQVVISHNWDELRRTMWDYVGIVRTTKRLERARARIANLAKEIHEYYWNFRVEPRLLELRNLIQIAELVVNCAMQRHESRGLHYTLDYPQKATEARDTRVQRANP